MADLCRSYYTIKMAAPGTLIIQTNITSHYLIQLYTNVDSFCHFCALRLVNYTWPTAIQEMGGAHLKQGSNGLLTHSNIHKHLTNTLGGIQ